MLKMYPLPYQVVEQLVGQEKAMDLYMESVYEAALSNLGDRHEVATWAVDERTLLRDEVRSLERRPNQSLERFRIRCQKRPEKLKALAKIEPGNAVVPWAVNEITKLDNKLRSLLEKYSEPQHG